MQVPFTHKTLVDWAGPRVVYEAELLLKNGRVLEASYDEPDIRGALLWNNRAFKTSLRIMPDGIPESQCPCKVNQEHGMICAHVIALALSLVKRAADPEREAKYREEQRRAARIAAIDEADYIQRVPAGTPEAVAATLCVTLPDDWLEAYSRGRVTVLCAAEYAERRVPLDQVPRGLPLSFSKQDENLLYVLEDVAEGPAPGRLSVSREDFVNIVRLRRGMVLQRENAEPVQVNDTGLSTYLHMDLDRENGELILIAHTELPFAQPTEFPVYLVWGRQGWVYGADNIWKLKNVLPRPYHAIYDGPVVIPRTEVLRFLSKELPVLAKHARIESDISLDLFSIEPAVPRFRLQVRGSPASLVGTLYAQYDALALVAGKPDAKGDFANPDPSDLMRYTVRNTKAEQRALELAGHAGLAGSAGDEFSPIADWRKVLNFLGTHLPALRRRGWQVELEGKIGPYMESLDFAVPVVHVEEAGNEWFDVGFDFEDSSGSSLSQAEIQLALRKGDAFVERGERTILIDSESIEMMQDVFSDCAAGESAKPGHFRMQNIYAPFIKASLDGLDGVDLEAAKPWRERAAQHNRTLCVEPVEVGARFAGTLRPYQKEGVDWLRFLEENGFAGILADEMGLGKTIETLAWLQLTRHRDEARNKPALIVCPSSLVDNWAEEAARFTPELNVTKLAGADREEKWEQLDQADIAIASYAILRRDIEQCRDRTFSAVVLDEAQHIKNRSTQNAQAAKQLQAHHRLVLTGTPIENSTSDLWSIMDFLMRGYLGAHDTFRHNYELPISHGGPFGEVAQLKLKRKLHPFLLRRLKKDVAKDLPPKIEKIASCSLSPDQKKVYTALLDRSRRRIGDMVAKRGFNQCRMEILTTLMRLRQVCCHLDLLKLKDLKPAAPSAKLDVFFEFLDEALDGGHRILVFSQFVEMLKILRKEMEQRKLEICYLDGSTKNRQEIVHRFNTQREIPAFLISLKAGGTGLNLTGADMVVHYDPWWNPAVEDQATDRAHRIGQKRTVYSIKLITRGTVEEKVLALQQKKKSIIDATLENDEQVIKSMTWDDVQELLSL